MSSAEPICCLGNSTEYIGKLESQDVNEKKKESALQVRPSGPRTKPSGDFRLHPVHEKIPRMSESERESFLDDIRKNGVLEPVKVNPNDEDQILDGRERYWAAVELGLDELSYVKANLNGLSPLEYAIKSAVLRRHLSKGQRAMLAAEVKPELEKEAKRRKLSTLKVGDEEPDVEKIPQREKGKSRDKAGSAYGVSGRYVDKAEKVKEEDSTLAKEVRKRKVSLNEAYEKVKRKSKKKKREKKAKNLSKPSELDRGELPINEVICGDAIKTLKEFPDNTIHFTMFSPSYWNLRDYGTDDQIGLEDNYHDYIQKLVDLCSELKRVLKNDGSLWIVIDDTYSDGNGSIPRKSKMFIPSRLAQALVNDGWICRNEVYWVKQILFQDNKSHGPAMPTGVKDRLAENTEKVYYFVQNEDYWFDLDAVRVPIKEESKKRAKYPTSKFGGSSEAPRAKLSKGEDKTMIELNPKGKNPGNAWRINPAQNTEGHPASYPEKLVERPMKATCPPKVCSRCGTPYIRSGEDDWIPNCGCDEDTEPGIALDPMCGIGKTLTQAKKLDRSYIGIDLNPDYVERARKNVEEVDNDED